MRLVLSRAYKLLRRSGHATSIDRNTWSKMQMRRRMLLKITFLRTITMVKLHPFSSLNASAVSGCQDYYWIHFYNCAGAFAFRSISLWFYLTSYHHEV